MIDIRKLIFLGFVLSLFQPVLSTTFSDNKTLECISETIFETCNDNNYYTFCDFNGIEKECYPFNPTTSSNVFNSLTILENLYVNSHKRTAIYFDINPVMGCDDNIGIKHRLELLNWIYIFDGKNVSCNYTKNIDSIVDSPNSLYVKDSNVVNATTNQPNTSNTSWPIDIAAWIFIIGSILAILNIFRNWIAKVNSLKYKILIWLKKKNDIVVNLEGYLKENECNITSFKLTSLQLIEEKLIEAKPVIGLNEKFPTYFMNARLTAKGQKFIEINPRDFIELLLKFR